MADLNTDIRYIKGVGEARAKAFEKLGVFTLGDLIAYYPRRWEDRSQLYPIRDLPEGEYACCKAMIAQPPTTARIRGGQTLVQVRAVDEGGVLDVSFFHQEYRKMSCIRERHTSSMERSRAAVCAAAWSIPCWRRRGSSCSPAASCPFIP